MHFTIHADGGARGNPGPAGAGAIIRDEFGVSVASVSKFLGHQTNNFAEYEAVILAFEALVELVPLIEHDATEVAVKLDSELVVKQMNGLYKVRNPVLREQKARLAQVASAFGTVSFIHVPREENGDADALANAAMDRGA
ncbi:MAG: ribonuclease HI family protein [Patescibacteria group bacterium]